MKFVKVKFEYNGCKIEYDEWFLVVDRTSGVPDGLTERMSKKLFRFAIGGSHAMEKGQIPTMLDFIVMKAAEGVDYEHALSISQYPLLIRESGSYMVLSPSVTILQTWEGDDFPRKKSEYADIVVCENDRYAHNFWLDYLKKKYPRKKIFVISYFDTRFDSTVKNYFERAEYVTFSTTFTSMDWWELLVRNLQPHNKVIGHCESDDNWNEAMKIYSKVERVKLKL